MSEHVTLSKRELDALKRLLACPIGTLRTADRVGLFGTITLGALVLAEWLTPFDVGASLWFIVFALGYAASGTVHRQARLLRHQDQIIRRLSGDDDPHSGAVR